MAPTPKSAQEKYEHQKKLARERQRRRKEKLTDEQKEAKKKYDRERMAKLRSEKKIKGIGDMTPREQRKMRKYWRGRNQVRKEKIKAMEDVLGNTPPPSPDTPTEQRRRGRKKVRKEKAKAYRTVKKQEKEIKILKKRVERYKKRLQREKEKTSKIASPSPNKQVKDVVGRQIVSPAVKKQLFLGFVLKKQVETQRKMIAGSNKRNQLMQKFVGNKILKKYRVQNHFQSIVPYKANKILNQEELKLEYSRKKKNSIRKQLADQLLKFFEDDNNSKMCPGKKDFVKRNSLKKQRRVLLHSLQVLHKEFVRQSKCRISFSTFTRARPFWVSLPKKCDRETCACIKHANMELLVSALNRTKVIEEKTPKEILNSVVCSIENEDCLTGKCSDCKNKTVSFHYNEDFRIKYFQWRNVSEENIIKNKKRIIKRTKKVKVVKNISMLKVAFVKELDEFKKHVHYSKHQISFIKHKTENLSSDELVFRIDFSENYVTKMAKEVQSFHFGASKRQLSLNTGVRYANNSENVEVLCFATVSDNIDHQAHAIWAHMHPILQKSAADYPNTKIIHFVSDSPSNEYRNRFNVHLFKTLVPQYFRKLKHMTWNYTEAGHGKGPMDGVGGTLKRMADKKVSYGTDITCAKDFVAALKDSKIFLTDVPSGDIEKRKAFTAQLKIAPITGIMKVHQFTYSEGSMCDARELSCFVCPPSTCCPHYKITSAFKKVFSKSSIHETEQEPSTSRKKHKLSVDDVYGSSEDEDENPIFPPDEPMKSVIDSTDEDIPVSCENLQSGDYVIVEFTTNKMKRHTFVGICQSRVCNDEIDIMFMKPCKKNSNLYFVNENDRSSVITSQIKAVLPQPKIMLKGKRVFYKFLNL